LYLDGAHCGFGAAGLIWTRSGGATSRESSGDSFLMSISVAGIDFSLQVDQRIGSGSIDHGCLNQL
jgi:hypothetical protein